MHDAMDNTEDQNNKDYVANPNILHDISPNVLANGKDRKCVSLTLKPVIFRKVKEVEYFSGGVILYAAQSNTQIDAEIA